MTVDGMSGKPSLSQAKLGPRLSDKVVGKREGVRFTFCIQPPFPPPLPGPTPLPQSVYVSMFMCMCGSLSVGVCVCGAYVRECMLTCVRECV